MAVEASPSGFDQSILVTTPVSVIGFALRIPRRRSDARKLMW
jgi:hypothetical protein